ncbi:hypothetical protein P167DRAFT_143739 [Morchella conica CCBAS932]|uniref:Uncharacterized protein n=1 Tax=Morchella conica CCBAS932 TaxID=1392247 RepID=A0A3N4KRF9_9PEZI|nr:hypothetical protein P167DRAFT_143739 [Morchella conica CCBAS932]
MSGMSAISNSMSASGVASTGSSSKSGGGEFGGRFIEISGLLYGVLSIPDSRLPAYTLRWISWALSIVNTLIKMVVKRITSAAKFFLKKVLAVIEAVLSSINFGLLLAIKIIEFNTDSFPGKNNVHQGFKLLSSACDLGATLGNNFGILAVDPALKTKALAASTFATALWYSIEGGLVVSKLAHGEYNEIIAKIQ